jgi:hypothetical protein
MRQYIVYNGILRQWPEDLYQRYVDAKNLFGTTIFVLVNPPCHPFVAMIARLSALLMPIPSHRFEMAAFPLL